MPSALPLPGLTLALLGLLTGAAGAAPLALHNSSTSLAFTPTDAGFALTELRALHPPRDFLSAGQPGGPLWRLDLRGPGYGEETQLAVDSAAPCRHRATLSDQTLTLRWLGLSLPGEPAVLDVTVTVTLPPGEAPSEWRISVASRSRNRGLWRVDFPVLPNLAVSERGDLAQPLGWGIITRDPVCNAAYSAEYPSLFATMQLSALSDRGATLYVSPQDPDGHTKQLNWHGHPDQGRLEYALRQDVPNAGRPGQGYSSPFPTVIGCLRGDWYDAAKQYRRWVVAHAPWAPRVPLEHSTATPRWLKENPLWLQSNGTGSAAPTDSLAATLSLKQALGNAPLADQPYWWQVGWPGQTAFDEGYPDTFFTLGRGDDEQALLRSLQAGGVRLVPYTNAHLVDARSEFWKAGGWRCAALPAAQAARHDAWIAELNAQARQGPVNVPMCPYTRAWQDHVVAWSRRIVGDFGFDGVYLDQVGCVNATPCFDPSHGHPLGGGDHWVQGYRQMLRRVQAAIRDLNPDAILTTESAAEPFGYFDSYLRCNESQGWMEPLWPAVYGGLNTSYGSYLYADDSVGGVRYAAKFAQLFVYGAQLGWVGAHEPLDPRPRWLDYLQDLAQARLAAARWIGMGEYLRPPRVRGAKPASGRWRLFASEYDVTWPSVLSAAFAAADGSVVLVFTNFTDRAQEITWDAGVAGLGLPPGCYATAPLYPPSALSTPAGRGQRLAGRLSLPPLSARVLRITPL